MTYFADLSEATYVPVPDDEYQYLSVGWLGDCVERSGPTAPEVLSALKQSARQNVRKWGPATGGPHTCEICGQHTDGGEFFIEAGEIRYLLPKMVLHYIAAHSYKLPDCVELPLRSRSA